MKKMMFTLIALLTMAASARAMSYEQARNEALFLTDKMAYELNLSDAQYEAAYEINLDYLMGVTSQYDVYGPYWERRNLDLSYILFSWQWDLFRAATYFYRPLVWDAGYWHFSVYRRYPHRDYFYFGRPHFYASYRGGHSWRMNGGRSFYEGRRDHYRPGHITRDNHFGMRNGWDRGDYRNNRGGGSSTNHGFRGDNRGGRGDNNGYRGGMNDNRGGNRGGFGSNRGGDYNNNRDSRTLDTHRNHQGGSLGTRHGEGLPSTRSMDNGNSGAGVTTNSSGSFGGSRNGSSNFRNGGNGSSNFRNGGNSSSNFRNGGNSSSNFRNNGGSSSGYRSLTPSTRGTSSGVRHSSTPSVRHSAPSTSSMRSSAPATRSSSSMVRSSSSSSRSGSSMGGSRSGGSRSSGSHGGGHSGGSNGHFGGSRR